MAKVIKSQTDLIGAHPNRPDVFGVWLSHTDGPVCDNKKHRILVEDTTKRALIIEQLSEWIIQYHLSDAKIERFQKKAAILSKYNFDQYIEEQKPLPGNGTTAQKGNATEIMLSEYLKSTSGMPMLVFKLRYNPNVDQAMKGDDVLLFDMAKRVKKIIVGEAKFRATPSKPHVKEIVSNLQENKIHPISIGFIAQCLEESDPPLSEALMELNGELHSNIHDVRYVGFLFGNTNTTPTVDRHLDTTNPNLVFLSLGVNDPVDIIEQAFAKANAKLKALKK